MEGVAGLGKSQYHPLPPTTHTGEDQGVWNARTGLATYTLFCRAPVRCSASCRVVHSFNDLFLSGMKDKATPNATVFALFET